MKEVTVYGADWCPLTARALRHLTHKQIPFKYINVETDSAASEWVKRQNNGKELKPTIDIEGLILSEPSNQELDYALR
jgi:glutaredoxin